MVLLAAIRISRPIWVVQISQSLRSQPRMIPEASSRSNICSTYAGHPVFIFGDEIELAADQAEDAANRGRPLVDDPLLSLGRRRIGSFQGQLQRAEQPPELAEPAIPETEILPVNDMHLVALHDGRLVNRFEVVLAEVGLKCDIHGLGQMLQGGLESDLRGLTSSDMSRRPPALRAVTVPLSPVPVEIAIPRGTSLGFAG